MRYTYYPGCSLHSTGIGYDKSMRAVFAKLGDELAELDDWAKPADPTNLLLFEAIGGNGKSMLTWEWTTNHATQVRDDWAGRFWYSFYERGAIMADSLQIPGFARS